MTIDQTGNIYASDKASILQLNISKHKLAKNDISSLNYLNDEFFVKNNLLNYKLKSIKVKKVIKSFQSRTCFVKSFLITKSLYIALLSSHDKQDGFEHLVVESLTSKLSVMAVNSSMKVLQYEIGEVVSFDISEINNCCGIAKKTGEIEIFRLGDVSLGLPIHELVLNSTIDINTDFKHLSDSSDKKNISCLVLDKIMVNSELAIGTEEGSLYFYNFEKNLMTKHFEKIYNSPIKHIYKLDHQKSSNKLKDVIANWGQSFVSTFTTNSQNSTKLGESDIEFEKITKLNESLERSDSELDLESEFEPKSAYSTKLQTNSSKNHSSKDLYVISGSKSLKIIAQQISAKAFSKKLHTDWARGVAVSSNGKYIASCGVDRKVNVMDLKSRKILYELENHQGREIFCVKFSSDNRTLASCSGDSTIKLFDVISRRLKLRCTNSKHQEVTSLAFSPTGKS